MSNKEKKIVSRWGNPVLDDWGFVTLPGWILRNYHKCGVTPLEMMFITHIMSFKYDHAEGMPENAAKPSLATIATYMGRDVKNVRRIKNGLVSKKLLKVYDHPGDCNEYNFAEFTNRCLEYATRIEVQQVQKGTVSKEADTAIPDPTPDTFVRGTKTPTEDKEENPKTKDSESNTDSADGEKTPPPGAPKIIQETLIPEIVLAEPLKESPKKEPTLFDVIALEVFGLSHVNGNGQKVGAFLKNFLATQTPESRTTLLRDLIEMFKWWVQTHFDGTGAPLHKPVRVETICRALNDYRQSPRYKDLRSIERLTARA